MHLLFNPFISITPSKPLMSSGSWLTLHNCEIFYLLAVNNDPATADLIFIRVNIYPGPGERGSLLIFLPIYFIRVTTYLPCVLTPQYQKRSLFTQGSGGEDIQANFPTHLFYQGHYLPHDIVPQYQQRSLFTLQHLLPCFGLYQGHYSHQAFEVLP